MPSVARRGGTTTSTREATASHRTPAGTGAAASARSAGEPGHSVRTSPNGKSRAHAEPPSGAPTVTTRVTRPAAAPSTSDRATITPPRLWPTRVTERAPHSRAQPSTRPASRAASSSTVVPRDE